MADAYDNELKDTATSPMKQVDAHMTDLEKNSKKRLTFEEGAEDDGKQLALTNHTYEDNRNSLAAASLVVEASKEKKRYKKADGTMISGTSTGSAASLEDDRRIQ